MAVGFADMRTKPVALFVACMLTATVVEWLTAKLLERLHNRKWWDYMADIMETNPDNSPVSIPLPELFYMA